MPRFVRPSWIEVSIEGRKRFASGPCSKNGTMIVQFLVRDKGSVAESIRVETRFVGSKHKLTVYDIEGVPVCAHTTELD